MRRFVFALLTCSASGLPVAVFAQVVTPASPASGSSSSTLAQAAPPTAQTKPPQAPATPAAAPAEAEEEKFHSLFEVMPRQFVIGGRFSDISGDPARFQRYQDLRSGLLFTEGRYASEGPSGSWFFDAGADNVGWRDQRYFGN